MAQNDKNDKNDPKPGVSLADVAAAAAAAAASGKEPLKVEQKQYPPVARVRATGDRHAVHLITGEVIPHDSDKKIEIDGFARAQLDAGKWAIAD